jgi:hypothetical protein
MIRRAIVLASVLFWAALGLRSETAPPQDGRHWWEKEPLRIIDLVTSTGQVMFMDAAEMAARKAGQSYNAEHLEIMDLKGGLDDSGFFFASPLASRKNPDFLKAYLAEAHKHGLRVMIYFNVHWYKKKFGQAHPDWLQIRENGQPLTGVYETGTSFCVNTAWREWCFQILRDLCAYPIDGIFYDGPIFFPETCYCPACQEKFRKLTGHPMPSKKERLGAASRELLKFQARSLADFLSDSRAVIKAANPEIAFYMNGGERGGNWSTGRLNRVLVEEEDILGSEGGFIGGDLSKTPIWKPGVTARFLETQSGGKPRVIFSAAGHKPWTFSLLPAPELKLLYAQTIANGAGVWFGMWPFEFGQPEMKALSGMNEFLERNKAYFTGAVSAARAAILWSDDTSNFYAGSTLAPPPAAGSFAAGQFDQEFSGLTEALIRTQTPFDVIDDAAVESGSLGRYSLVILPNAACLSDQAAASLRRYVEDGGHVFATFETSLYDRNGIRRKDFALAPLFGASSQNGLAGPKRWDFMKPLKKEALTAGLDRELIPSPEYHVRTRSLGAKALLQFMTPLAGPYEKIPEASEDPALYVHETGRGRTVYFAGDLGGGLQKFRLPEFFRLAANVIREFAPSPVVLESAPASIDVVLRTQENGKRLILHILNLTGEMTRPIERIIPLRDLAVRVEAGPGVKSVSSLMAPRKLEFSADGKGTIRFTLPRVEEYEVVVIEK